MKDSQNRKLSMAEATKKVMDENLAIWNAIPAIVTEHGFLGNNIVRIKTLSVLQNVDNTGIRTEKLRLRKELSNNVLVVAGPVAGYALVTNNETLFEKVDVVRSDIINGRAIDALDVSKEVFTEAEAIDPAILGGIGVTPAMLNDLNTAIVAYEVIIPKTRFAETDTKAITKAMAKEFRKMRRTLKKLDHFMEPFSITEEDFYNTYHNARIIVDTGTRKIHLIVKCVDAVSGAVVAGAEVSIVELAETLVSTKTGNARFFSLPPGSYTVTITHEYYQEVVLEHVGIFTGKTTRFDLEMVRV